MSECIKLLSNICAMVENDESQYAQIQAGLGDIIELIRKEASTKEFLADSYENAYNAIFELEKCKDQSCEAGDFTSRLRAVIEALENEDFPYELDMATGSFPSEITNEEAEISAVLTLYKRPERLVEQLEALESQTIPPKYIYLFQDRVSNGVYTIQLTEEIKKRFTNVHVCEENIGVWGRFDYASKICETPYVVLFDDDTIPGKRWLENCYMHMKQKEGIYVTLGVCMKAENQYPYNGFFRVGWGEPCIKNAQVDFGGHSWFVKKEHLKVMIENGDEYRKKYKYVAEDAFLSFINLKESGVPTIVPIHYHDKMDFWGSDPYIGRLAGIENGAVSMNPNNLNAMTKVVQEFRGNGWKLLSETRPEYFEHLYENMKNIGGNANMQHV